MNTDICPRCGMYWNQSCDVRGYHVCPPGIYETANRPTFEAAPSLAAFGEADDEITSIKAELAAVRAKLEDATREHPYPQEKPTTSEWFLVRMGSKWEVAAFWTHNRPRSNQPGWTKGGRDITLDVDAWRYIDLPEPQEPQP